MDSSLVSLASATVDECRRRARERLRSARGLCVKEKEAAIIERQRVLNSSLWRRLWKKPPVTLEQAEDSFSHGDEWITSLQWADIRRERAESHVREVLRLCSASCDGLVQLSPFHAAVLGFSAEADE